MTGTTTAPTARTFQARSAKSRTPDAARVAVIAAREHLGYEPHHSSADTLREAVQWLAGNGELEGVQFA